jgi:hypothetical protein
MAGKTRKNYKKKNMKGGADAPMASASEAVPPASQAGGRRHRRRGKKSMKGGADAPMMASASDAPAAPATEQSGGRRRGKKTRKMSSGADKWRKHMMQVYRDMKARNPATKLGDAMRAAKKTYTA